MRVVQRPGELEPEPGRQGLGPGRLGEERRWAVGRGAGRRGEGRAIIPHRCAWPGEGRAGQGPKCSLLSPL